MSMNGIRLLLVVCGLCCLFPQTSAGVGGVQRDQQTAPGVIPINYRMYWTDTQDRLVVTDDGNGVDVTLPCNIRYVYKRVRPAGKISLAWYLYDPDLKLSDVYQHRIRGESGDFMASPSWSRAQISETRFSFEKYSLKIKNVSEDDQGRYCCNLYVAGKHSVTNCTDLYYNYLNKDNGLSLQCDKKKPAEKYNIWISDTDPATVSASAIGFYPDRINENPPWLEPAGDMREFSLLDMNGSKIVSRTNFRVSYVAEVRYDGHLEIGWNKTGLYTFTSKLDGAYGSSSSKNMQCHYYTGVNRCEGVHCRYGGTCLSMSGGPRCLCNPAFTGKFCEKCKLGGWHRCVKLRGWDADLFRAPNCNYPKHWQNVTWQTSNVLRQKFSEHTESDSGVDYTCFDSTSDHHFRYHVRQKADNYTALECVKTHSVKKGNVLVTARIPASGLAAMCDIMPNASATEQCEAMLSGALKAKLCLTLGLYPPMYVTVKDTFKPKPCKLTEGKYHAMISLAHSDKLKHPACGATLPSSVVKVGYDYIDLQGCGGPKGRMQCVENLAVNALDLSSEKGGILILADHGYLPDQPYFRILRYKDDRNGSIEMSLQSTHQSKKLQPKPDWDYNTLASLDEGKTTASAWDLSVIGCTDLFVRCLNGGTCINGGTDVLAYTCKCANGCTGRNCESCKSGNLALKKPTYQSSTSGRGYSRNAVDSNRNTNYGGWSCTHTSYQRRPWWAVDLGTVQNIGQVVITNRGDCSSSRLNNAHIGLTNVGMKPSLHNTRKCAFIASPLKSGERRVIDCVGTARYLAVILTGKGYLTLCEVEVYSNLALKKPTYQSSTSGRGYSRNAVDGNRNTNYGGWSCTHTSYQRRPWWAVDLGTVQNIGQVVITNRGDCCSSRLNNAHIGLTNVRMKPSLHNTRKCAFIASPLKSGERRVIDCVGTARYLAVILTGKGYLTLCEVEVYSYARSKARVFADDDFSRPSGQEVDTIPLTLGNNMLYTVVAAVAIVAVLLATIVLVAVCKVRQRTHNTRVPIPEPSSVTLAETTSGDTK